MPPISKDLYTKILSITDEVKKKFYSKGYIIPIHHKDNSISLGPYIVSKDAKGFYEIVDINGTLIFSQINLPQTAILVANNLALGKFTDQSLLQKDRNYGYALFDEQVHRRLTTKKSKNFELMSTKASVAKAKKEYYKKNILKSFEKLRNFGSSIR